MGEVIQLRQKTDIKSGLINIAEHLTDEECESRSCTVIIGNKVFCLEPINDEQAGQAAIFDMTNGISHLMYAVRMETEHD
tara:strand:- start:1470 stop:1709 length:240 start_codon:yes stop_codon:yes gene_type:complete